MTAERERYRIPDEPRPGPLGHLVVDPMWPLFGVMFAGSWLCWPWYVFNGFAMGSPTRRRETLWAVAGFLGNLGFSLGLIFLAGLGVLPGPAVPYAVVGLTIWKLLVSYKLYLMQSQTFDLYEYFGGVARNGLILVILGAWFGRRLILERLPALFPDGVSLLWRIVLR